MARGSRVKSVSEAVNAQLAREAAAQDVGEDDFAVPDVDEFEEEQHDEPPRQSRRVETASKSKRKLRSRGPLDTDLSSGAYSAVPISVGEAEANVDDIFALLEEGADEVDDDLQGIDDEEAYVKWVEESERRKPSHKRYRDANAEEEDILDQIEALRQRQREVQLHHQADESTEADDADAGTQGQTLKALVHTFSALLRLRVKLQPVVAKFVQMPQYYALPHFIRQGECDASGDVKAKLDDIRNTLVSVQESLAQAATALKPSVDETNENKSEGKTSRKGKASAKVTPSFASISSFHEATVARANGVLGHWAAKVQQHSSAHAKLKVVNQPLVDQIKSILHAKVRLFGKVQRNRSHLRIFGHPNHVKATTIADRAEDIAAGDIDEEIFDDADFVRELVHRGGAAASSLEAALKAEEAKLLASVPRDVAALSAKGGAKVGFHKKTKGKSLNYHPRPKLVGFMARVMPHSGEESVQHQAMLASLFQ